MHLAKIAVESPDKAAIIMAGGEQVTYAELNDRSNQVAQIFHSLGLRVNDALALFLPNCPQYFYAAWGAQRSGLYYTPVSTHLSSDEIAYILENCEARLAVVSAQLAPMIVPVVDALPQVKHWLFVGDVDEALQARLGPKYHDWDEMLQSSPAAPIACELEGCDMLYSSGTTGYPKGIKNPNPERAFGNPSPFVHGIVAAFGVNADTVYLSPAPLYHASPLRFCMAMHRVGATAVVMEQFEPNTALRLIEQHRVNFSQWVPTMFVRLLKLPAAQREAYNLSSHRMALHSAAPCPLPVKEQMIDWWGPILVEYYGSTEGHGGTQITSQEWLQHRGSVGRPTFGEIHILDEAGEELPAGEIGIVYFSGGAPFEYHKSEEKTAGTRRGDRATVGDIGYVDDEGYLYLTDRQANMIISGGVNIYPQEAENVLIMHPAVADVAVVGVPDVEMGEAVKAVIELSDGEQPTEECANALLAYCREHLSHVKCPRSIDFEEKLPRSDAGKLFKRRIKARYWKGHESNIL